MVNSELFEEHVKQATAFVASARARLFEHMIRYHQRPSGVLSVAESPLEQIFALWWHAFDMGEGGMSEAFALVPQKDVEIGGQTYRLDFCIELIDEFKGSPGWIPIAIELDGHAFHERTHEQVRRRDSRDRALSGAGWRVLHFSFSEFVGDPVRCIVEVVKACSLSYAAAITGSRR